MEVDVFGSLERTNHDSSGFYDSPLNEGLKVCNNIGHIIITRQISLGVCPRSGFIIEKYIDKLAIDRIYLKATSD